MSLQVWLPLNGNLNNNGIYPVDASLLSGTSYSSSGKIGSALYNSADGQGVNLSGYMSVCSGYSSYTIAAWVYLDSTATGHSATILSSGNWNTADGQCCFGFYSYSSGYRILLVPNKSGWSNGISLSSAIQLSKWYHVCITYDGSTTKGYINGNYIGSYASGGITAASETTDLYIGRATYYSGFTLKGKINDVRIYNNVISDKEIKEISNGLVLHYPLNNPYIETTTNLLSSAMSQYTSGWSNWCSTGGTTPTTQYLTGDGVFTQTYCKETCYKGNTSNCAPYTGYTIPANTTYTFSAWVKGDSSSIGLTIHSSNWTNEGTTTEQHQYTYTLTNEWQYIYATLKTSAQSAALCGLGADNSSCTSQNVVYYVCNAQLEAKDHPTPWVVGGSSRAETTVYDVSGYNRNGIITSASAPQIVSNSSPRYIKCAYFDTTAKYISVSNLPTSGLANSYTFSWWGNVPSYTSVMYWGFNNGNRLNLYHGQMWNTGDGDKNPFYSSGTTTVSMPSVNVWHHFVITGDGTTTKYYLDGVLYGTAKTYVAVTGSVIYINGWSTETTYKTNGYESDFRIYATALSADDVKLLYNSPISVTNTGSLMTQGELVEE